MPSYTLNTAFSQEDLKTIYATGSNVVIAKPTGVGPKVAWVVYKPLIDNAVDWDEEYAIYASNTDVINGAVIKQMSATAFPAAMEKSYTMQADGYFSGPNDGGSANSYTALNEYNNTPKSYLTMGLCQPATVNGNKTNNNVLSAAGVMYQSTAVMTPYTTVYIWLQSQVVSNTVVTTVTSPMTKVVFGGGVDTANLQYNAQTGKFDSLGKSASLVVEHIEPELC